MTAKCRGEVAYCNEKEFEQNGENRLYHKVSIRDSQSGCLVSFSHDEHIDPGTYLEIAGLLKQSTWEGKQYLSIQNPVVKVLSLEPILDI